MPNDSAPDAEKREPSPIGLYNFGEAYLQTGQAALLSSQKISFSDPIEHLFAHGIELIFKADLIRTRSLEEIRRNFGHDLVRLRQSITPEFANQWNLDREFDAVVDYLALGHSGYGFRHRYLQPGYRRMIELPTIRDATDRFSNRPPNELLQFFGGIT